LPEDPNRPYVEVVRFSETFLDKHPESSAASVGWVRGDGDTRYRVMLELIVPAPGPVTLLDFGCGLSHLYGYILRHSTRGIQYSGLDLSEQMLERCRRRYPEVPYYQVDVLAPEAPPLPPFDYIVMNGIFTYLGAIPQEEKFAYLRALVTRVFSLATKGVAFNVMSKQVEWERDDLFHVPLDPLLTFLAREVSRHVVIRHDYGLYEYTVYVYKQPTAPEQSGAKLLACPPAVS
jgi:SAM-dependent methyltransferase